MRYPDFLKDLKLKQKHVYGLIGENEFLKDEGLQILKQVFQIDRNLGILEIDAKNHEEIGILEALNSGSFSERSMVLVENIDKLDGRKESLKKWIKSPLPGTIAVFRSSENEVDITTNFYKQIALSGCLAECWNLSLAKGELSQWTFYRIQRSGKTIDQRALEHLVGKVGNNLYKMANEIKKLVIYAGDRPMIRVSDVELVVEVTVDTDVFDLLAALNLRQKGKALGMISRLFRGSETGIGLISLLQMHLDRMLKVVTWQHNGMGEREMTYKLGVHPYQAKTIIQQCHTTKLPWIFRSYRTLIKADTDLKAGLYNSRLVIERMVLDFCR